MHIKSNCNNNVSRQFGFSTGNIIPARLDAKQTAGILGFQEHDVPILVAAKLLRPLGKPVPNATKYFATCEIEALAMDSKWLRDATQTLYDYWRAKNERKSSKAVQTAGSKPEISLTE